MARNVCGHPWGNTDIAPPLIHCRSTCLNGGLPFSGVHPAIRTDQGGHDAMVPGQTMFANGFSSDVLCGVNNSAPSSVMTMSSSSRTPNFPR